MGDKSKKPKQLEVVKDMYTCPICGKDHKNNEICPIVIDRFKKVKFDSQSYLMSGILLECLERRIDFFYVLKEMAYLMEKYCSDNNKICLYFNADFIISYFASFLGCTPSKFFKRRTELYEKYAEYIESANVEIDDMFSEVDEKNNLTQISMKLTEGSGVLWEMMDAQYHVLNQYGPALYLHKVFGRGRPTYYFTLEFGWYSKSGNITNKNEPYYVHFDNICFSERGYLQGFDLYAEKEGKLRDFFESNFYWIDIAREHSCTSIVAEDWITDLEHATKKGMLIWNIYNGESHISYFTTYGNTEIEIQIARDDPNAYSNYIFYRKMVSDCIFINENDRKMYHYDKTGFDSVISDNFDIRDKKSPRIVKIPMIRKLEFAISQWNKLRQNQDYIDAYYKKTIKRSDVLSVTYSFVCTKKGHKVTPYCGLIKLINPEGEEIEEKVYLGYCRDCNVFYIFARDYGYICKKGKPQCKVIDASTKKVLSDVAFMFNSKSILSEIGYNVQASSGLNDEERQDILKKAISEKIISENEILNLLELQIHLHSGDAKYRNAIEKWKKDSDFVKSYGIESGRTKRISSIKM